MSTDNILVTGFGPFGIHKINSSWEAVKLLPNKFTEANIIIREIPVLYKYVDEQIPILWEQYKPKLVIHVGVQRFGNKINIETRSYRQGYVEKDCEGNEHETGAVCSATKGEDCIETTLDAQKICDVVNSSKNIKASVSTFAGRYLCAFTYYKSLSIDPNRTIFIHVPVLNDPYSAEELAEGLVLIIKCALEQLSSYI